VILAERNPVIGGNCISTVKTLPGAGDFVFDEGPNSAQPTPAIMKTVADLKLNDEVILADGSLPRFVYWEGDGAGNKPANLHALPTNLPGDLLTFQLLSWPGRIRAAIGAIGLIAPQPESLESVSEFVTRHLGAEAFERIIAPFCSGVYAGDPDKLCMSAGLRKIHRLEGLGELGPGLVSGALVRFKEIKEEKERNPPKDDWLTWKGGQLMSFKKGLQTLPNAVGEYLSQGDVKDRVRLGHTLESLAKDEASGVFTATFSTADGPKIIKARTVAMTSPAPATARILGTGANPLVPGAKALEKVYQPPVVSVVLAYKNELFKEDLPGYSKSNPLRGFGILFPRNRGVRSLGIIFNSSLFPNRAPKGYQNILTYIGGTLDTALGDMSEEEIVAIVDKDIRKVLLKEGVKGGECEVLAVKKWKTAIPQYEKNHFEIMAELEKDEKKVPGLFINGNWRSGVAFGDCVQVGLDDSKKIASYVKQL